MKSFFQLILIYTSFFLFVFAVGGCIGHIVAKILLLILGSCIVAPLASNGILGAGWGMFFEILDGIILIGGPILGMFVIAKYFGDFLEWIGRKLPESSEKND